MISYLQSKKMFSHTRHFPRLWKEPPAHPEKYNMLRKFITGMNRALQKTYANMPVDERGDDVFAAGDRWLPFWILHVTEKQCWNIL